MPDLIELQKDKTLFEAKTEEVSLHKQIKQQENQIPPLSRNTNESRNSCPGRSLPSCRRKKR